MYAVGFPLCVLRIFPDPRCVWEKYGKVERYITSLVEPSEYKPVRRLSSHCVF